MKLVIGLGNPGRKYQKTRHNLGFLVIDALAKEFKIKLNKIKYDSLCGDGWIDEAVILAEPMTFMNLSGKSVNRLIKKYKVDLKDTIVIYDDLNLDLGVLKIKKSGSSGGHNGIKSIIEHLQSNCFPRIRLGIGRPNEVVDLTRYVLSTFQKEEHEKVGEMVSKSVEAIKLIFKGGIDKAMTVYNKKIIKKEN
ncbi:aminoacyl-tRNA hydrolase [bacterium]|nr:aminoacyl-tRNA hydrolase [bacterium]